ncbi:MAG: acetylxylan esterase [Solirubrobacterales bacterium]|nr:acetylxylan esterase [Solirubrobacterales bacterium]
MPASALAAPSIFVGHTENGTALSCTTLGDGVRQCHGSSSTMQRLKSFDGTPLEVYVILPPGSGSGPYPLIAQSHGWGGNGGGAGDTDGGPSGDTWAKHGYAVLQLTARGFNDSCGSASSRLADPSGCTNGYIRLDDDRYEVHDIQFASGLLVDEGLVNPNQIGATGDSYGGGVTMQLATLKDRIMNPDGSLSQWKSPGGTPMHLAAGAPDIPWSDLVHSLVPNGRTLDYSVTGPNDDLSPIGVLKQSFVAGLYAAGQATGYYSSTDPSASLPMWYAETNAGEPYDSNPQDVALVDQIAHFHSAYYLLDGKYGYPQEAPAPLQISNGFTDDLFPVDEALRYYNYEQAHYPGNPISLIDGDFGHMRAQNKPGDQALVSSRMQTFMDHYVRGVGSQPQLGATATTETCPSTAPSGGPFSAASWDALHPGEVDAALSSGTLNSAAGEPSISAKVDPIAGGGACATVSSADQGTGVITLRVPPASGNGYTLLGSATVIGTFNVTGTYPYVAARLWDVNPSTGQQTLVARGLYRVDSAKPNGLQVFQLHPGSWHFASGHIPKLELLGQDAPYSRRSNGTFSIQISNLQLHLPVHEVPGAPGTPPQVTVPCGTRPTSRITRRRTHMNRKRLIIRGTTAETPCAYTAQTIRSRQHVAHVRVAIARHVGKRCRFVKRNGHLSGKRSCKRPIWLTAKGTKRWHLRLKLHVGHGRYVIQVDAVDYLRQQQRPVSRLKIRVR